MSTSVSRVGHFPMLEDPDGFNRLLEQAVEDAPKPTAARPPLR